MKKFNAFVVLVILLFVQVCFAEDEFSDDDFNEIPDDYYLPLLDLSDNDVEKEEIDDSFAETIGIDKKYELNLDGTYLDFFLTSPFHSANGDWATGEDDIKKHETQGLANINGEYWILSKNNRIEVFRVTDYLFSESDSDKVYTINKEDNENFFKEIDFFDGNLYVSRNNVLEVYPWNSGTEKFGNKIATNYINTESFGSAIHRQSKVWFYGGLDGDIYFYGQRIGDNGGTLLTMCQYYLTLKTKNGIPINHKTLTVRPSRQGMVFSPNGWYFFYVQDDDDTEYSNGTGIYIYYIDYDNYIKLLDPYCEDYVKEIEAKLVSFINIKYDPDYGICRLDELEGIDVGNILNFDLRLLILHNECTEVGKEYHSVLHFIIGDSDGDGVKDIYDNCPFDYNFPEDLDGDGIGDSQKDLDGDGIGDKCDRDRDGDDVPNIHDKCPDVFNPNQADFDEDGVGDVCDNCPNKPNPYLADEMSNLLLDSDGKPYQLDTDGDGIGDVCDNCPNISNSNQKDSDFDGFGDMCDNCPNDYNPSQADSDGDGFPDACDKCPNHDNSDQSDVDGDGVGDICDNCLNVPNERVVNNREIVVAPCELYFGQYHVCMNGGARSMLLTNKSLYKDERGNWWWQPDHDLDGTGDACEENGGYNEWSEFRGVPIGNSVDEGIVEHSNSGDVFLMRRNETLSVTVKMGSSNPTQSTEIATTRYCWLPERIKDSWGSDGYCTTEAGHTQGDCEINFGYSHGSDPAPVNDYGEVSWNFVKDKEDSTQSKEFTEIKTGTTETINWDWRHDFKADRELVVGTSLDTAQECQTLPAFGVCEDSNVPKFYYTMSTGVHSGDMDEDYITSDNQINPAFFKNDKKYTRSSRLTLESNVISYHKERVPHFAPVESCIGICNFPIEELHDMIIDRLIYGPRPYEMPGMEHYFKNAYGSDLINTGVSFREWSRNAVGMPSVAEKSRPVYLLTITENTLGMNEGIVAVQNSGIIPRSGEAASPNLTFEITAMDPNSNGDWRTQGVLNNVPAGFMPTASVYHNGSLYVVSKNGGNTTHLYKIQSTGQTVTPTGGVNICFLPRVIFDPVDLGGLTDLTNITLHSVGNNLLALGKTTSGMKVYKLSEQNGNPYFEDISGTALPQIRDVYNLEVKDGVLYLAGGALLSESEVHFTNDIWRFTETGGWQLIRNDLNIFPITLRIDFDGNNIILTDRVIRPNGTTERAIFADDGTGDIVIETVPVEGAHIQGFGDYCLKETDSAIQGGIETSGECIPFTHPWYTFSAGATVYSLDGKGERLYVGTNNAIKVYDISDPIAPVLVSSFSTSSRVNDLEVYGDTLFAATNSGLYKLDASDPDELTQVLFISATLNYQYKVEVYDGKLYVGDDNGIKVRDLETLSVLTSVNNGSVLDFAIENGEIGLYKDALFSPVEIRDAETLTLKANEFFGCFEIEVGSSDGRFYLSCDDERYRFEDDGDGGISFTELSGDIRELQDVYTFDGYTYFYDENTIWISTSNDVPAICGNGIVEGDEICDGGQIDCEELDSNYVSGTATCNSTCDGYNTNNCSDDGW